MKIECEELDELKEAVERLVEIAEARPAERMWYTKKEAWALKGGMAWNSFRQIRYFQPKGGIPDKKLNGNFVWSRETIEEWLPLCDEELEAYNEKYATGAKRRAA